MTINATTGLVTWTPTTSQAGSNNVTVQVADSQNNTATQSFTINVADVAVNQPPVITSTPPLTAWVGEQYYAYNAAAADPDGDPIYWKLLSAPAGMSVNPNIGTVRWIPTLDQIGPQTVTLQAVDPYGGSATQTWTINVLAANLPPVITSIPPTQATQGKLYSYAIQANDPDGDTLKYQLNGFRSYGSGSGYGGNPDPTSSGLFTGTPAYTGAYDITVTVTDDAGLTATQEFILNVASSPPNYPPAITSTPSTLAANSQAYNYQVLVTDQDGDAQTYSLTTSYTGTSGPTISSTGLVNWASPVAGTYQFTVTVTDAGGLQSVQTYTLTVENDTKPAITNWNPPTTVTAGLSYRYDVQASDSDGDALTYALSNAPTGMTIDSYGRINWAPGIAQIGVYNNITVTVTDPFGNTATDSFNLTVAADTKPPSVELTLNTNPLNVNQQETLLVFASDDVGVTSLTLTWSNGGAATNLDIDSKGQAFFTPTTAGTYTFTATATDAAGNTATATQNLTVSNPNGTPPTITLTAPVPDKNGDPNITAPTAVTGTVSDDHMGVSYTVTVVPYDGSPSFQIGSGSTTTASSLAISNVTFDPTMLANGDYKIEIKATDTDDNLTTTLDQHVSVSGHLKLGRETLSVTDLTIPVAGIPVTITRSYDSLNAGKSGDFGYGWSLSYGDAQLEVDLAPGADIGWGGYPAFLDGTRVFVTMPNGEREGFTFQPYEKSYDSFGLITYWHPYFVPDPGVLDTLTAPDALLTKDPDSGEYYSVTDTGIDTYNPEDPNYGGTYTVTNLQGMASTIDATTGKLLSMKARNGNTLTFSDTEINSNTGRVVTITRDPAGYITAITDPNHNSVTYSYDVNGNLVSVTDRMGNPPTKYQYNDPNHAHYLTGVVDPLGVQQLTVSVGSDGRMSQMKDAANDSLNFAYDTTNLTENVTDPNLPSGSQTATVDFDTRGNVLQTTDPTGAQSSATYNNPTSDPAAKDLPDTVTQTKRNADNTTTSYTTQLTFDNKGEVTGTTDPTGAVTHTTYGPFGEVVTTSDALGNTTTNSYDTNGNLLSTVSAAAVATYFSYDTHNNLTEVSQGSPINPGYSPPGTPPPPPAAVTTYSYDTYGNLSSSTSPTGVTTNDTYDANGNPTGTSYTWVDPNNSNNTKVISTSTQYNANDQETASYDEYGHPTKTFYDGKGRVTSTVDVLNNTTQTGMPRR